MASASKARGLGEQRVDAAGAEALEVVAAGGRAGQHVAEPGAHGGRLIDGEDRLDDGVTVAVEVGQDASEQPLIHRRTVLCRCARLTT